MTDEENVLQTEETFETWLSKPYVSDETRKRIANANLLLVPRENVRDVKSPQFPQETERLFLFLKDHPESGIVPELCADDDKIYEFAFHDAFLILGSFILTTVIMPVFVNLLSDYIKNRISELGGKPSIEIEMTVVDKSSAVKLRYKGLAEDFSKFIIPHIPQTNLSKKIKPGSRFDTSV